ncbi:hypothetical protein SAMN02745243_04186, partial [Hespellia stercorisuis DSM 15480]
NMNQKWNKKDISVGKKELRTAEFNQLVRQPLLSYFSYHFQYFFK